MKTFNSLEVRGGVYRRKVAIADAVVNEAKLHGVALNAPRGLLWQKQRHQVERVSMRRCTLSACHVEDATLRDVSLEECHGVDDLTLEGCWLHRVRLGGEFTSVRSIPAEPPDSGEAEFYQRVDWALDLLDFHFSGDFEAHTIPAEKVRFRAEIGGILDRTTLAGLDWNDDGRSEYFAGALYKFRLYGGASAVYLVPDRGRDAGATRRELDELKAAGVLAIGGSD